MPYEAFAAGLGDHRIVTTLCPGGKERMRRLMEVVRAGRVDLTPLLTHTIPLEKRLLIFQSLYIENRLDAEIQR
jgi:threonine dehydrogenase-like Zn-dependent dehydrogenase